MRKEKIKLISFSDKQTKEIAEILAQTILQDSDISPIVFALKGNLGSGKTSFIQGIAKGLGIKQKILSPTFNIFKKFRIAKKNLKYFYHFDCYRIEDSNEIIQLGFNDIIKEKGNLIFIEWAERIKKILPKNTIWIEFKNKGGEERGIKFFV
jgi:tRNA threonylcarbamoyladenosine biosynthesis protein TsaE